MALGTLLKSVGVGAVIAGIPLLPWDRLDGVGPVVGWLMTPGVFVGYLYAGPHNLTMQMVAVVDFLVYSAVSYFVVSWWERWRKRNAS